MAITLTNEMRDAVHEEDCTKVGHQFDFSNMTRSKPFTQIGDPESFAVIELTGPEEGMLPYLSCARCGLIWILFADPANTYVKALKKLKKRLVRNDPYLDLVEKEKKPKGTPPS